MKKKFGSLTTFGIISVVVLYLIMSVHIFLLESNSEIWFRLLVSIFWGIAMIPISGAVFLAIFLAIYAGIKLSAIVFKENENQEDKLMENFLSLSNPLLIIIILGLYIAIFLWK